MKNFASIIFSIVFLSGCADSKFVQPDTVNISIDKAISPVHAQALKDAALQWAIATDGRLWVNFVAGADIKFEYKVLPPGQDGQRHLPERTESAAFIYIRPDLTDNTYATLLHELGHLWGLDHLPSGVMRWDSDAECIDSLALQEMATLRGLEHTAPNCDY